MDPVLFLFPTLWDRKQLEACRDSWSGRIRPIFDRLADADCPWDLDVPGRLETIARDRGASLRGVTSSSDYPGAVAAALLARRLGLPGPAPPAVLCASHKYCSRLAQKEIVPEAVPEFRLLDPETPVDPLPFPYFVKPVKGSFSILARRIDGPGELTRFLGRAEVREHRLYYVRIFDRWVREYAEAWPRADRFLAEEYVTGDMVTVEGYAAEGEPVILGVVDSVRHPETGSFLRFDYPSRLPPPVQDRMEGIARRLLKGLGFQQGLMNVEMIHDPATGRITVIEVNPRLSGQFADLYLEVDGKSSYEVLLDLARGADPRFPRRKGRWGAASSFPLRVFEPAEVEEVPGPDTIATVEGRFPGVRVWMECSRGEIFRDFDGQEDGASARYGVVNVAGADPAGVETRFAEVMAALPLRLRPLASPAIPGVD